LARARERAKTKLSRSSKPMIQHGRIKKPLSGPRQDTKNRSFRGEIAHSISIKEIAQTSRIVDSITKDPCTQEVKEKAKREKVKENPRRKEKGPNLKDPEEKKEKERERMMTGLSPVPDRAKEIKRVKGKAKMTHHVLAKHVAKRTIKPQIANKTVQNASNTTRVVARQ
jgi:hypothetical protein